MVIMIKKNHLYPQILSVIHTPAVLHGNTFVSIENKARITIAPFKTPFGARKLVCKAGAGPSACAATQLIVTVWRTGSSYKRREDCKSWRVCS